jgi:SWI/SNF-related matrix-associated actin-dependent regulator of chromatin subfamily D
MPAPPQSHLQHGAQLTPAQLHAVNLENQRRNEMFRRQARKPTDRDIPRDVSDFTVGDGVERYRKLRDVERRLDAVMMRKRLDISENGQRRFARREGVLRIAISNTAEGQPWQVIEEGNGHEDGGMFELNQNSGTYRMKIEGRLLEDPSEDGDVEETTPAQRPRLSHFFKAITVDFDRNPNLQPDGYSQIEWRKPLSNNKGATADSSSTEVNFDTLEFERKTDENMDVTINLTRDEKHERFKLSPALADLLDTDEDDKTGVVQGIWDYCRANGLQEDDDKRKIVFDEPLRKVGHTSSVCFVQHNVLLIFSIFQVFNQDNVYFPYLPELLAPHLTPIPPLQLSYTIRVDKPYISPAPGSGTTASAPTIYHVRVPLPNPLHAALQTIQTSTMHISSLHNLVQLDDDLALLVQKIQQTTAKRTFFDRLSKEPHAFIPRWIASQQRDLAVILAEGTRSGIAAGGTGEGSAGEAVGVGMEDALRKGGADSVWGSGLARESVGLFLARGSKAH